jgi:hypothetical protein
MNQKGWRISMPPFLSVIMPVYNGERYIAVALDSVRKEYVDGIELVIVDDGSTDKTLEIVNRYSEILPIKVIRSHRTGNSVIVSNIGLEECQGEWVCYLHHDDFWLPGRVSRIREAIYRAKGAIIFHNSIFVGPQGENLGRWTCPIKEGEISSEDLWEHLLVQNFIAIPSPVFRRREARDSGAMDQSIWISADWDLWLRLSAMAPAEFIAEPLSAYRIHPASLTLARHLPPGEWHRQLTVVLERNLQKWPATGRRRKSVERAARVSVEINSALSSASRGESVSLLATMLCLLPLGPAGLYRYLRDSRLIERVMARMRLQRLQQSFKEDQRLPLM